jgi:glycosyltransferase involved in cell wall biosynthesis
MSTKVLSVACIAADLHPEALGGAEVAAVETIKRLSSKHHLVVFVGNNEHIRSKLPKNVEVICIYYPRIPNLMGLAYVLFGAVQIAWHLKRKRCDLIWAKQEYPQAIVGAIIKNMFKKPLYATIQNPRMHEEELVVAAGGFFKKLLPKMLTPVLSWSYAQADVLAAVSHYSAREVKKMGGTRVVVIPNGVNAGEFGVRGSEYGVQRAEFGVRGEGFGVRSTKLGVRSTDYGALSQESEDNKDEHKRKTIKNTFTIVSTSSLIPRNGMDTLIAAVALLPKNITWRLIIAGEGPERKYLKSQISSLKLDNQITLLGRVENKRIPELLSHADIFVRPSRFEGFGVAFLEAMAAGVPVIATPVGGIPDFIKPGETGILVDPDDPVSLAKAIELLAADQALSKKLTNNALKLVKEKYQWDVIVAKVESEMLSLTTNH